MILVQLYHNQTTNSYTVYNIRDKKEIDDVKKCLYPTQKHIPIKGWNYMDRKVNKTVCLLDKFT